MIVCKKYDTSLEKDLKFFCNECEILKIKNNTSLKKLKLDIVEYFCLYDGDRMIGISGFSDKTEVCVLPGDWQLHYRLVVFPEYNNYFKRKSGLQGSCSLAYRVLQTECLKECKARGGKRFLYTTNDNASMQMRRHSIIGQKKGLNFFVEDRIIYNVQQTVWRIDYDAHFENMKNIKLYEDKEL